MPLDEQPVFSVNHLTKQFGEGCSHCLPPGENLLDKNTCPHCGTIYACRDLSFDVYEGEILGVVGESGSGKSTMLRCLCFDTEATFGQVYLRSYGEGRENLLTLSSQEKRKVRNLKMGMVYQNPFLGLKMKFSSISNIAEQLIGAGGRQVEPILDRGRELFQHVQLPEKRLKEAPIRFSGGMQQRVQIAKALSNSPSLLLLDEMTTGLDLSVQASVLDLIRQIQRELKVSMVFVSHDLSVIRMLAHRTIVMLDGRIIESGLTDQILEDPKHPYTQELVYALL